MNNKKIFDFCKISCIIKFLAFTMFQFMKDDVFVDNIILALRALPELKKCYKKTGNNGAVCGCLAKYKVRLNSKSPNGVDKYQYRCETHKTTPTTRGIVVEYEELNDSQEQTNIINKINYYLGLLVGYEIKSHFHTPINKKFNDIYYLYAKYVHKNQKWLLMCQTHSGRWVAVHYNQLSLSTEKLGMRIYADVTKRERMIIKD